MGNKPSKKGLDKDTLDFLTKNTNFEREAIKDWYAGFKKDCPSGQLSPDTFVSMYNQFFPQGNAEQFSKRSFRTFDTDNSGTIDFTEFLLALHVTSAASPRDKLQCAFRMYDVDGNGAIDMQEMNKVIQGVYLMLGSEDKGRAAEVFKKMDLNSDGKVTEQEFMEACSTDSELMTLLTNISQLKKWKGTPV